MQSKLRNLRISHGLTLSEVAKSVGIHQSGLSRIERGVQKAPLKIVEKLCAIFNNEITEIQILYPERFAESKAESRAGVNHGEEANSRG